MIFTVAFVPPCEVQQAKKDRNYQPTEVLLANVETNSEQSALQQLELGIEKGFFPKGSELVIIEENYVDQ